jgi:Sodium/hydrogen exchanger family
MGSLLPTLVLIVLALVGARVSFSTEHVRLGPRLLFRTGTPFVLLGFALGPSGVRLLTREAVEQLYPLLAMGLGWVGFHFGLQLDRSALGRFPKRYYVFALGQAAGAFAIFAGGALAVTRVAGLRGPVPLLLVLGAAATAAVTTPAGIALVSSTYDVRGRVRDLLFFVGSIDAIVGIVALQTTYSLFPPASIASGGSPTPEPVFIGIALGVGIVCGIAFIWLTRSRPPSEELVLFLLGSCAFASGVALQWDMSPLFVSATMGAVVANLGQSTDRARVVLARWEKPVYVTFLLLAGVLLEIPTWVVFPMAVGYVLLRFLAKVASAAVLARLVPLGFEAPRRIGLGLVPQGGIAVAMAVSAVLLYSDLRVRGLDAEAVLFAVVVMGVALSELSGPLLTLRVLERAGELAPGSLTAPPPNDLDG